MMYNTRCENWGVTDHPPLKESRPEIRRSKPEENQGILS